MYLSQSESFAHRGRKINRELAQTSFQHLIVASNNSRKSEDTHTHIKRTEILKDNIEMKDLFC